MRRDLTGYLSIALGVALGLLVFAVFIGGLIWLGEQ